MLVKLGKVFGRIDNVDSLVHYHHSAGTKHRTRSYQAFIIKLHILAQDLTSIHYVNTRAARDHCLQLLIVAKHSAAIVEDEFLHVGVAHRKLVYTRLFYMPADRP